MRRIFVKLERLIDKHLDTTGGVDNFADCPSGVARPAKQPEFQLVLHQG